MAMVKDPVCSMVIDSETAAGESKYGDKIYYFCSENCKVNFDTSSWKYVSGGEAEAAPELASGKKWWEFWK